MEASRLVDRLEASAEVLGQMLASVSEEQARWRPEPGRWSVLEIAAHLLDEEREDFRARLRSLLEDPAAAWPAIDPQGWVASRDYALRDLASTSRDFAVERARSLTWLRSLGDVDWEASHEHPQLGPLRAGDLLAAWAAHDALHIRQLAGLEWAWTARLAEPFSPSYAGDW